jgi:predicted nucleic acid-binding protein
MILCDTSGLLALLDSGEREHRRASAALEDVTGPLLTTDFVLAELDYLISAGSDRLPRRRCSSKSGKAR